MRKNSVQFKKLFLHSSFSTQILIGYQQTCNHLLPRLQFFRFGKKLPLLSDPTPYNEAGEVAPNCN